MTKYKIVLIPFPFDDLSANKVRPAVCLTDPIGLHKHVVLAFITSKTPDHLLESDIIIDASAPDFPSTGLKMTSTIRLHRLMTVTTDLILRQLGELSPKMRVQVKTRLNQLFALGNC